MALLVGLTEGQDLGWASPAIVGLFAASAALFVIWGYVELRVDEPMVDMRMLARRTVLFTNLTAMLSGFALYMTWVILPTFYQLPSDLPDALKGAADYGLAALYVSGGIHAAEYGHADGPEPAKLAAFLDRHGFEVAAVMPRLG